MKKQGVAYWKKKLWTVFSEYTRVRDALRTTGGIEKLRCCSCGKLYPAFGIGCAQAGHFIPGRHNAVLFDPMGVHGQCYNCNVTLKGNWVGYLDFMHKNYGRPATDDLIAKSKLVVHFTPDELVEWLNLYKALVKNMRTFKQLPETQTYEAVRLEFHPVPGDKGVGVTTLF